MAFVGGDTNCPCCFRPGLGKPTVCVPVGGPKTSGSKLDVIRQILKVHGIGAYVQVCMSGALDPAASGSPRAGCGLCPAIPARSLSKVV